MIVKYKLFFFIFLFSKVYVKSQEKEVDIKRDSLEYIIAGQKSIYKRVKITNNSNDLIIFWLTKNKESPEKYFGQKGDFSLKELLTENSVENFNIYPVIFLDFIKIIKPKEDFYLLSSSVNEPYLNIYSRKDLPEDILSAINYAIKYYPERFYLQNMIYLPR